MALGMSKESATSRYMPRSRKVRVLATLGPASDSPEMIRRLAEAMHPGGAEGRDEAAEDDIEIDESLDDAALIEEQEETDDDVTDIIGEREDDEEP